MDTVAVQVGDGAVLTVRLHPGPDGAPVVVIVPGLGVPPEYYDFVASALVKRGLNSATVELGRGGYQSMVAADFPAMFEVVRERFDRSTPYLLGHSLGGQLSIMYASRIRGRLGGLILVASGSPFHRGYGLRSQGMYLGAAAVSFTAAVAGHWPGDRLGAQGFGRQSKELVSDWSRFARTGKIDPVGADIDYEERIARLTLPVLSISIEGDDLTPPRSMKNLVAKMPKADVTIWHEPKDLGHNGWIADSYGVVERTAQWIRQ
jgi:predicted alpha/beta hydrolase